MEPEQDEEVQVIGGVDHRGEWYVVEELRGLDMNRETGRLMVQVKWLGYEELTWEPLHRIARWCPVLFLIFMKKMSEWWFNAGRASRDQESGGPSS